jgi:glycosyltransferase involved in cell wall biosynthesis
MINSAKQKIFIVVPAFNEAGILPEFLQEVKNAGYENILVVDDGSSDDTLQKAQAVPGVIALRHKINRGKGAAVKTGMDAAKLLGADIIVTLDGDGQHDPKDIEKLIAPLVAGTHEVVLGTRLKNSTGMPFYKKLHNHIANILTWYLFGLWVTDSQSGFRAYSRHAADLINTRYDRYEYDSEVIREIYLHKLKFQEVPIAVRYTKYSLGKENKQNIWNGFKALYKMFWKLLN